jgi:hypothetical protein
MGTRDGGRERREDWNGLRVRLEVEKKKRAESGSLSPRV